MQLDVEDITGRNADNETKARSNSAEHLRSIVTRIERLEEEKKALSSDISDIRKEAKSAGYNPKAITKLVQERRLERAEAEQLQGDLDLYRDAMGG